jgi:hypothetical protein
MISRASTSSLAHSDDVINSRCEPVFVYVLTMPMESRSNESLSPLAHMPMRSYNVPVFDCAQRLRCQAGWPLFQEGTAHCANCNSFMPLKLYLGARKKVAQPEDRGFRDIGHKYIVVSRKGWCLALS